MTAPAAPTLYPRVRALLADACALGVARGLLPEGVAADAIALDRPKQGAHGDLATNLFFGLARQAKGNPRALAEAMLPLLREADSAGLVAAAGLCQPAALRCGLAGGGARRAGPRSDVWPQPQRRW
jgi:hypothetical protein